VVRAGGKLCVATMEVRTASGRLVATGSGTFVVSSKPIRAPE
jgi:acyl-coenzyme A thioesterase PaaI-like protein